MAILGADHPVPENGGTVGPLSVLIVDDEFEVREIIRTSLERERFKVAEAADARSALAQAVDDSSSFDLILLDLGLPDVSGFEVLKLLRRQLTIPIIVLSGHGDEADRILGLELGADDYIPKPFSSREVVARAKAVCRRAHASVSELKQLEFGELRIDRDGRRVFVAENVIDISAREFDLLEFLATSPGKVWTSDEVLSHVWNSNSEWQSPTTVREHVYRLRRKIETDPGNPRYIVTVRGGGYRFDA